MFDGKKKSWVVAGEASCFEHVHIDVKAFELPKKRAIGTDGERGWKPSSACRPALNADLVLSPAAPNRSDVDESMESGFLDFSLSRLSCR